MKNIQIGDNFLAKFLFSNIFEVTIVGEKKDIFGKKYLAEWIRRYDFGYEVRHIGFLRKRNLIQKID